LGRTKSIVETTKFYPDIKYGSLDIPPLMICPFQCLSGWWFQPTPLKNMKVSWDDDIPNKWKHKIHVPNISKPPIS
jgi:hypothetical protein